MKYIKTASTDFFEAYQYNKLLTRIETLRPDASRKWGKMSVEQMLHHLNLAIGSGLGYYELADTSNFASRNIIKYLILDVIKKFPPGSKTADTLKSEATYQFSEEKEKLVSILQKAFITKNDSDWGKHTFFGEMSRKEWGKLIMIHVHHHLQQFNC